MSVSPQNHEKNKTVHLLNEPIIEVHSADITIINKRSLWIADLSKVTVAVDVLLLVAVLQLVVFNVKPKSLHDTGTCLCVHTQQTGQTGVQFILRRLGTNCNPSVKGTPAEKTCAGSSSGTWWSSMKRRVHFTLMSPGLFTWKPSVSWVVGILCHWKKVQTRGLNVHTDENCVELVHSCRKKAESEELSISSHQMFLKWCHTSTKWLSGPYSSLSSSITRLLKKDENFFFCLPGWENKKKVWRERERESDKRRGTILLVLFCYVCVATLFSSDLISGGGVSTKLQTAKKEK